MVKIVDHQQTGKRKFIIGPGRKKDTPLVEDKPETKMDVRTNAYLKAISVFTQPIQEEKQKKEFKPFHNNTQNGQHQKFCRKKQIKLDQKQNKFMKCIRKARMSIDFLNTDKKNKESIREYINNIQKIVDTFRFK